MSPGPAGSPAAPIPPAEEVWEAEVGGLLAELPAVEPPSGFLDAAIDHRPLHAGRTLLGLVAATLLVVGLVLGAGGIEPGGVVPPIDELVARHDLAARAGLGPSDGEAPTADPDGAQRPLSLPEGFEAEGSVTIEDIRQAVYARGEEAVSVFVQEGRVDWGALPPDRLTDLGGLPAWVDGERSIAVIEADDSILTVIGLAPEQLDEAIQGVLDGETSLGERATELAEAVVVQFGYAPVD